MKRPILLDDIWSRQVRWKRRGDWWQQPADRRMESIVSVVNDRFELLGIVESLTEERNNLRAALDALEDAA